MFIPEQFRHIRYNSEHFPGSGKAFAGGANCQMFAYELLRYHGLEVPDFRSSELWDDKKFTCVAIDLKPLDLILINKTDSAWGAHVVVYLGDDIALHLSKETEHPRIELLHTLQVKPEYQFYIGAKRIL